MERINLDYLGESKTSSNPNEIKFCCPYCSDEKFHLCVNIEKRVFLCQRCRTAGRITSLKPSLDRFQDKIHKLLQKDINFKKEESSLSLPLGCKPVTSASGLPYRYLRRRMVTSQEIEKYKLMYCPHGLYGERILIPIYDQDKLVYYVTRSYTNRVPKYLYPPVKRVGTIFKTFEGRVDEAVIVEGCFGAMRVAKVYPAIALLGKDSNTKKVLNIVKLTKQAHVMLDPDANNTAMLLWNMLSHYIKTTVSIGIEKCPDEMNELEIRKELACAFSLDSRKVTRK